MPTLVRCSLQSKSPPHPQLAYRGGDDFDEAILDHGRMALIAYIQPTLANAGSKVNV